MAKKDTRYLFRVEKEIINKLKIIAAKKSVSVSELIRISLKEKYSIQLMDIVVLIFVTWVITEILYTIYLKGK